MTTTDLYALCPCGSGKKIKFCCRDILGEIEKIYRMLSADQWHSCLEKIDRLLVQHPKRPALLTLRIQTLQAMGSSENIEPHIDSLLEADPGNIFGNATKAELVAFDGRPFDALPYLHRAFGESRGEIGPMARRVVPEIILCLISKRSLEGLVAAHALTLFAKHTGALNEWGQEIHNQLLQAGRIPSILIGVPRTFEPRENASWKREFDMAMQDYISGNWTSALAIVEAMNLRILDEPILLRAQATLLANVGRLDDAAKTWRMLASVRGLPFDEAVFAEAMALGLTSQGRDFRDVLMLTIDLDDFASMRGKLLEDRRTQVLFDELEDDRGRGIQTVQFLCYDRPLDAQQASIPTETPTVGEDRLMGMIELHHTDDRSICMIELLQDERVDERWSVLTEAIGIQLDRTRASLRRREHFLESLAQIDRRMYGKSHRIRLERARRDYVATRLRQEWADIPFASLNGKTVRQSVQEPKTHRIAVALLLHAQLAAEKLMVDLDDQGIRHDLGLPPRPPESSPLLKFTAAHAIQSDLATWSDQEILQLYIVVGPYDPKGLYLRIVRSILTRPNLEKNIDFVTLHLQVAELDPEAEDSLWHIQRARELAIRNGQSPAITLIREMALRIRHQEIDHARLLLTEIQTRYYNEKGVPESVEAIMSIINGPNGPLHHEGGANQPPSLQELVTIPGGDSSTSTGKSLWLPDADESRTD